MALLPLQSPKFCTLSTTTTGYQFLLSPHNKQQKKHNWSLLLGENEKHTAGSYSLDQTIKKA